MVSEPSLGGGERGAPLVHDDRLGERLVGGRKTDLGRLGRQHRPPALVTAPGFHCPGISRQARSSAFGSQRRAAR